MVEGLGRNEQGADGPESAEVSSSSEPVEARIGRVLVRSSLVMAIPVLVGGLLAGGSKGLYSAGYAEILVVVNYSVATRILVWCARISPVALMGGALGSFGFVLVLLTAAIIPVARASWMDLVIFGVALIVAHIVPVIVTASRVTGKIAFDGFRPSFRGGGHSGAGSN
ncbi:MAG: hypothetical protein ACP5O0_10660 [Acidimicrobiales bacterium]